MFLIAFFYYSLCAILLVIASFALYFKTKQNKYKNSIPSRFFLKNNPAFKPNGIHLHACSLGEVNAIKPIVNNLQATNTINITTITNTGYDSAKSIKNAIVRYLPFEVFLPFWLKRQKALIVFEAELWFMLFYVYNHFLKTPTILLNARISKNSFASYKRFRFFYKIIFKNIDLILAQSKKDKKRLQILGAKNIKVIGNIKFVFRPNIKNIFKKPKNTKIILAASTHDGEEKLIIKAFIKANNANKNTSKNIKNKLIMLPRHPQRFEQTNKLLCEVSKKHSLSYHRYSKAKNLNSDIVLIDTLGILVELYSISDIVILGGSFFDGIGGHNFVECAYFNNIIISGKYIFNQLSIAKEIKNIYLIDKSKLDNKLKQALNGKLKTSKLPKAKLTTQPKQITKIMREYAKGL